MGEVCEQVDLCASQQCSGRGNCTNVDNTFQCTCEQGTQEKAATFTESIDLAKFSNNQLDKKLMIRIITPIIN